MVLITEPLKPFDVNAPPRPMLARDADSMYWMSRYVERAEHVARLLLVNTNLLIDVGDLAPSLLRRQWNSVFTVFRMDVPAELQGPEADTGNGSNGSNGSEVEVGPRVARNM